MADTRAVNPLVDQFKKGGVPRELRLMAAQSALPLKPDDLVELLHHLLADADEGVRAAATASLEGFPVDEFVPLGRDRQTPPGVLGWALQHRVEGALREAILQNPATPDEAIEAVVARLPENLAELVVINQVRLLRRTSLLEALETNPSLNNDQKRRLRELRESFRIGAVPEPEPEPPPAPAPPPPAPEPEAEPVEEEAPISEADAMVRYLTEEERQQSDKVGVMQRLYRMNTAEKLVTALKGSREERAILIRDPNRLVSTAVLGSPRLTEVEIESFAGMKNVSQDVLRSIGNNKDWTKRYGVISSLVRNPRTPLAISIGMVSRLNPRDIKSIAVDRNVPEVIRKQAQRFLKGAAGPGGQEKR